METDKLLQMANLLSNNGGNGEAKTVEHVPEYINNINKNMDDLRDDFIKGLRLLRNRMNDIDTKNNFSPEYIDNLIDKKISNVVIQTEDAYTSKVRLKENQTVSGTDFSIINYKGVGMVNQLLCIANTNNFNVFIKNDDNIMWDKPYTYFYDKSEYLEDVSAFLKGEKYYLSIRSVSFQDEIKMTISSASSTIFDEIQCKYRIRDERPV